MTSASRSPVYSIAPARESDVKGLPAIERAAARLLAGYAPEPVLAETTSLERLRAAERRGHLWVALADDCAVGFAHVEILEADSAHLTEIDVLPAHGRRGLGTRLVHAVCEWAAAASLRGVTLTTFRDVPWNMPFYERLGFVEIPDTQRSTALTAILQDEARRGLDPARRVAMAWRG